MPVVPYLLWADWEPNSLEDRGWVVVEVRVDFHWVIVGEAVDEEFRHFHVFVDKVPVAVAEGGDFS